MEKLTKRAAARGREHRLEISLAGGVGASQMERHERSEILSKSELFFFSLLPECEDFLLALFEQQRFKANLFLLLSPYRKETGRQVPAVSCCSGLKWS